METHELTLEAQVFTFTYELNLAISYFEYLDNEDLVSDIDHITIENMTMKDKIADLEAMNRDLTRVSLDNEEKFIDKAEEVERLRQEMSRQLTAENEKRRFLALGLEQFHYLLY